MKLWLGGAPRSHCLLSGSFQRHREGILIGSTVSHYRILERLGGGGMGIVYKAQDTRLDRAVALKFLPAEWVQEQLLRERFKREARAASSLDHPNICTIFDIGETPEGQLFIAMAHCSGETLKHRILRGPLAVEDAVEITIQIADGLENAHEAGIVHRDIKPANLLFDDRKQIKIVDFGLAKLAGEAAVTLEGSVVGTPAYMSPEQATGETLDGRSDIWAVGAVLYEMLTGRRAFAAGHDRAILLAITSTDPTPIDDLRPEVPGELLRIVGRCLEREPAERYQHARHLVAELKRFRGESTPAEIVTQTMPSSMVVRRPRKLRRWLPAIAGVAILAAGVFLYPLLIRPAKQHLVVLPFNCPAADVQSQIMCVGLLDTVTAKLSELRRFQDSLSVVPASEIRSRRVNSADLAHKIFGIDLVISGSVLAEEETLRIPIELVDAMRLRQLRSRTITTEKTADFVLQDRVAEVIEEMLDIELRDHERNAMQIGGTRNAEAAELFLEARGRSSDNPSENQLSQAIRLYREALDLDPDYAEAMIQLAHSCHQRYLSSRDPIWLEHGTTYARRAVDVAPDLPAAHAAAGHLALESGDPSFAIDHLQRAVALDPLDLVASMLLATAYRATGDEENAQAVVDRAIRTGPEDWRTFYAFGKFFYKRHDLAQAAEYFRRVVELLPDFSIGHTALGSTLFYLGDRAGAREHLERACAIGCGYEGLNNLATLEFYDGRSAAAADLYRRALDLDDRDYSVWNNLAEATAGLEPAQTERVQAAYRRAAELAEKVLEEREDDVTVLVDLASFNAHLGDEAEARRLLERVASLDVKDPNIMVALADVFERLGERNLAMDWIKRAVEAGYPIQIILDYAGFAELKTDRRFEELVEAATIE